MKRWGWWGLMGLTGVIFFVWGWKTWDPDFGWHIQMGKYIMSQGIPATDPFSYTMQSFRFVDHEWLTNVALYRGYMTIGKAGLAIVFTLLAAGALIVAVPKNLRVWALIPGLLAASILLPSTGVRPQVETWAGLAVLLRLRWNREIWKKWRWLVPAGFGLWSNLHAGFFLGLASLAWIIIWQGLEDKRVDGKDVMVWILSAVATLINPYGWRLWYEVWMQISDGNLRWAIAEWQPFWVNPGFGFLFLAVMWVMFGIKFTKALEWWKTALVGALLLAGMSSLRHEPLFAIVATPVIAVLLKKMYEKVAINAESRKRAKIFYLVLAGVAGVIWIWQTGVALRDVGMGNLDKKYYPYAAVNFLEKQNLRGNLFASYNWGGFLIWKMPDRKVFIDGRMPSWRWGLWPEKGTAPMGESVSAFADYRTIAGDGKYEELFNHYGITTVLWSKPAKKEEKTGWMAVVDKWLAERVIKNKKTISFGDRLEKEWRKIYEDEVAAVYIR